MKISDFTNDDQLDNDNNNSNSGNGQSITMMPAPPPIDEETRSSALINYNDIAHTFDQALFRDAEIDRLTTVLSTRKKPNALVVGDAGVGKTQLIEEFTRRYVIDKDPVLISQFGTDLQIEELRLSSLIAGKSYVGQLEKEVEAIIDYATSHNVILFIDELHRIFSDQPANNVAQDLKQSLARQDLHVIGATTSQEVNSIRKEPAFDRRFTDVIVDELSPEQTATVIQNVKPIYEDFHNVIIPNSLIGLIVKNGDKYKKNGTHRPDTAITLLDRACAHIRLEHTKHAQSTEPAIQQYIAVNPIPKLTKKDIEKVSHTLINKPQATNKTQSISEALDQSIIGQSVAKTEIATSVNRLSLGIITPKRPSSFLFAGPSGTGKTEMAKQLAQYLFDDEDAMIRLDMSEFSDPSSINRIKGSPDGFVGSDSKQSLPFDNLQANPRQIILLDEFEKANQQTQLLFMQVLDEGRFTTERHNIVDFSQAIIIATTNAGVADLNEAHIGFNAVKEPSQTDIIKALENDFPIELLNRFEHVIAFNALTKAEYTQVLALKYNGIIKEAMGNRIDLQFKPTSIDINDTDDLAVLKDIADDSFNSRLNGRPAERTMLEHIETQLLAHPNDTTHHLFQPAITQPPLAPNPLPTQQS